MSALERQLNEGAAADLKELRELRETAEDIRASVANLHGRLDMIEALLKQSIEHRGERGVVPIARPS